MKRIRKLVATIGSYQCSKTGQTKKIRREVGSFFKCQKTGSESVKLDLIPTQFSGWIAVEKIEKPAPAPAPAPAPDYLAEPSPKDPDFEPF